MIMLAGSIEPALSCPFATFFRNNASRMRPGRQCDPQHFLGRGHFQIQWFVDLRFQTRNVIVANVASVLAQMRGYAVATGGNRQLCGTYRIGVAPTARVTDGGNVIDVDAETKTIHAL